MPSTDPPPPCPTTSPEKVYRAFLEADALAKWLPPNGFAGTVHHLEPKVGGTYKMSFRNFTTGHSHSFGGESSSSCRVNACATPTSSTIRTCPGEMQVTVTLKKVPVGTEVNIVQAGIPTPFPPRLVISAGRSRCETWRSSSSPRSSNSPR